MRWKCQSGKSAAIGKQLPLNALAELGHPEELKKAIKTAKTCKPYRRFFPENRAVRNSHTVL